MVVGSFSAYSTVELYCWASSPCDISPLGNEALVSEALGFVLDIPEPSLRDHAYGMIARSFLSIATAYLYRSQERDRQRIQLLVSRAVCDCSLNIRNRALFFQILWEASCVNLSECVVGE